jgi:hypothetical protein
MAGEKKRTFLHQGQQANPLTAPFILHIQRLDQPTMGASITLNPIRPGAPVFTVTESTVDLVKRCIAEDSYACGQLGLMYPNGLAVRPFQLGTVDPPTRVFQSFAFGVTLKGANIENGDHLWLRVLSDEAVTGQNCTGTPQRGLSQEFEERIQRIQRDIRQNQQQ